jgi:hypothetical protein
LTVLVDIEHEIFGGSTEADSQQGEFVAVAFDELSTGKSIFPVGAPFWFGRVFGGDEIEADVEQVGKLDLMAAS